jgi:hypothetical protein
MVRLSDNRTIEILPSKKYGLPNAEDLDFYRAFLKICFERVRLVKVETEDGRVVYHPELPVPIGFSSRELTVKANKKWSGRTNRAVREWIERLNSTAIHGAMFSAKERKYDVRIGLEPLFRQYVHVGHPMHDGQLAPQNYVWPAQWFLDNYYYLYTRPIDLKFHHRLTCSIAKALYPLLDAGWYASDGSPYTKRYNDLCTLLDIQPYRQASRVQQQLDPSHHELVREKFLASYDYPVDESGSWTGTIRWWPGAKWLYDQEMRQRPKRIAAVPQVPVPVLEEQTRTRDVSPQMALPLPSKVEQQIGQIHEQRVSRFYERLGQTRPSREKIHLGVSVLQNLIEEQHYSEDEIDFTLEWIVRNVETRFKGRVQSLGILPHIIGEALQEKAASDRKRARARIHRQDERESVEQGERNGLAVEKLRSLPSEEYERLRREAIRHLTEQGFQRQFIRDILIKIEMVRLLECHVGA